MKIILTIVLTPFLFSLWSVAQTADEYMDKLKRANSESIAKYQTGEYDDALKFTKIALDLTIVIFGPEHVETAKSYNNMGEIYYIKGKYRESADNLHKAYAIYQRDIVRNGQSAIKILDLLGRVLILSGKQDEAEPLFTQALVNAEKVFGKETKETLPALKSLTNFYIYTKQYDKADNIFLKRYLIQSIFLKKKDTAGLGDISDDHHCYMSQHFKGDEYVERKKAFFDREKAQRAILFGEEPPIKTGNTIGGGVVNGKAISLPKPAYPRVALSLGVSGSVSIKVLIDEEGNVISAKGFCGDPIFYAASEDAARKARFSPTCLAAYRSK